MVRSKVKTGAAYAGHSALSIAILQGMWRTSGSRGVTKATKGRKKKSYRNSWVQTFGIRFLDKMTCGHRGGHGSLVRGSLREGGLV